MPDCPNVLTSGNCTDQQCPNNHNVLKCSPCGFVAKSVAGFSFCVRSERHKRSGGDAYKAALDDAEKDKKGVKVEGDLEFGIVNQQAASRPLEKRLRIWATSAMSKVKLVSALLGQEKSHTWRRRLHSFSVTIESESKNISSVDATNNSRDFRAQAYRPILPKQLDVQSHGNHFKILLWVEEHRMEHDLARYDMTKSTLARHIPTTTWRFLALLKNARASTSQGIESSSSETKAHRDIGRLVTSTSSEQKYHIRFKLNKVPLWRQRQALDTSFDHPRILFPISSHLPKAPPPKRDIKPFNSLISNNPNHLQAIQAILTAEPGLLPFIDFGPPGIGKTMTIVEAIKQLVQTKPNARILACAPSNAAADLIASRLRDAFNIDELFRLYAPSRHKDQVPDELMPYTYYHESPNSRPCFGAPTMGRMKRFKVIVATCTSASVISGIGMPRGHFTHIFVDEAGRATEPEALVPIRMMADKATDVVLSGDPKQLGPIVRSGIASKLGLELSYLERLMELPSCDLRTCSGKSIVKLVKNYHSHNATLKYPNESFYEDDLQPCPNTTITDSFLNSPWLPNGDFPIAFHSVSGKDDREASSPSFFNIDEVIAVKQYVQQLKANREFRTSDQDIGVITPYHAQCQKIRRSGGYHPKIKHFAFYADLPIIQECRVIIISTVRSSKEFISYDIWHTLGFVASPRRFNVSVTRAKALLIVIGDPEVLGLDPLWRSFLNYVYINKGWKGPEIPWDSTEPVDGDGGYDADIQDAARADMNDFTRRLEAFALEGTSEDIDAGIDRPWRELD
ncbi:hypothetical protein NP233_g7766 [Leucocoprinus birnbaumii]|uniref:RNA helicase n=1 Tax=Leucocoprinus birnbaumii TaxID=56174 RepID=A0AAD5VNN7_9AGAR|nr:hypothetical protein NP233_g7766 [Leucocoprinus birnbaumii]